MLCANKNLKSLETMVNFEVSNVYDRLTAKKTAKKSNFVVFRRRQKKLTYEVNLKVFDYHTNTYISLERKKLC